jgi:hypothetical protein
MMAENFAFQGIEAEGKKGKELIRLLFSVYIPILLLTRTIPNVSSNSLDDR